MSSSDFRPWRNWRKYDIFWSFIFNFWVFEIPIGSKFGLIMFNLLESSNHEFESSKNIVLLSFRPWMKITGRYEQVFGDSLRISENFWPYCDKLGELSRRLLALLRLFGFEFSLGWTNTWILELLALILMAIHSYYGVDGRLATTFNIAQSHLIEVVGLVLGQ